MKDSAINLDDENDLEISPGKKMMHLKEESSFLPDYERPPKAESQKKIIKKVRFHDEPSSIHENH